MSFVTQVRMQGWCENLILDKIYFMFLTKKRVHFEYPHLFFLATSCSKTNISSQKRHNWTTTHKKHKKQADLKPLPDNNNII